MKDFRITLKNQISAVSGLLVFTIFVAIAIYLLGENEGYETDLFVFFGLFYLLNLLSVAFIHFQYFRANMNTTFSIDSDNKQFSFRTKDDIKTIKFSEVQKIDIYMMPSVYRGSNFHILPFEHYHCAIIHTKNQDQVITSLIVTNLVTELNNLGIRLVKHRCFYPYIRQPRSA